MAAENVRTVCIVGAGNGAHVLMSLLPYRGFNTTVFAPYGDEADRLAAGLKANGGSIDAEWATHLKPSGHVRGAPSIVSKHAADVVPQADAIIIPLPSFAYRAVLTSLKPCLRPGQILLVTPGQGGFDWIAREILGKDLLFKLTIAALLPMPFNCRTKEFGKSVTVFHLKSRYTIGTMPLSATPVVKHLVERIFEHPTNSCGSFLSATCLPCNQVLHPARMYNLFGPHAWEPGMLLPRNPMFYEEMQPMATKLMEAVNGEIRTAAKVLTENHDLHEFDVPWMIDFFTHYAYGDVKHNTLISFYTEHEGYKGLRTPMTQVKVQDCHPVAKVKWLPDFNCRYFTEDIAYGLVLYKGLCELANTPSPTIDMIILWAQKHMKKEYLVGPDNKLAGRDISDAACPQRWGLGIAELKELYNHKDGSEPAAPVADKFATTLSSKL